jgi:hypothetical protein
VAPRIGTIVSGGQTGVDRAALDVAVALGIPYVGWVPRGAWAEDGAPLLERYPGLRETPSSDPAERTVWNIRDSDAVLVLTRSDVASPGTDVGLRTARELGRPLRVVHLDNSRATEEVWTLLQRYGGPLVLSVGGPRESEAPGIYDAAHRLLRAVLGQA